MLELQLLVRAVLALAVAFLLGTLIGFERQWRQRPAAVGAFCGGGLLAEAVALTLFVLAGNTLLRPRVNYINRRPVDERVTEALYTVHVVCDHAAVSDARDLLFAQLEAANYPIREIETESEEDDQVELAASLVPTSAEPAELDAVVASLKRYDFIKSATWSVGTST